MEAGQDPTVACRVEKRQREALVAAGFLEGVVADQTDPLERLTLGGLEDDGPRSQPFKSAGDGVHRVEMRIEDCLEATAVLPSGHTVQPDVESAGPAGERHDRDDEDEDDHTQADDDRSEVRRNERVKVDAMVLLWGQPSLAGPPQRVGI